MSGNGPFLCYRQLQPASAIVASCFFRNRAVNRSVGTAGDAIPAAIKIALPGSDAEAASCDMEYLLTATINGLYVYSIHRPDNNRSHDETSDRMDCGDGNEEGTSASNESTPFLSLVNMFPVSGRIASVHVMPEPHNRGDDRIIATLDEGKYVVVRFSSVLCEFIIEDMYNAEEGAIGLGSEVHADAKGRITSPGRFGRQPRTVVDAEHRIACSLLYDDQLFVLPPEEGVKRAANKAQSRGNIANVASRTGPGGNLRAVQPFIVDFSSYLSFPDIIDITFLPGYGAATLAVLYRLERVPIGHEKEHRNLASLAVFTVDFRLKKLALLWRHDGLPNDSLQIHPIKAPGLIGGVFVVTMNACIIVKYDLVGGLATNGLAAITVSPTVPLRPFNDISRKAAELDGSKWISASDDAFVCVLNDGRIMCVSLGFVNATNISNPKSINVEMLAESVACATFTSSFDRSLWFLGAVASDSLLVYATHLKDLRLTDLSNVAVNKASSLLTPMPKKRKIGSISTPASANKAGTFGSMRSPTAAVNTDEFKADQEKEEAEMYGVSLKNCALLERFATVSSFTLRVVDTIASLGAVTDGTVVAADESHPYSLQVDWEASTSRLHKKLLSQNALIPATAYVQEKECRDSLQICAGVDKDGSLNRVFSGFRMSKLASAEFADAVLIDSLVYNKTNAADTGVKTSLIFVTTSNGMTRFFEPTTKADQTSKVGSILEGSVTERTSPEAGFVANFPTLFVGSILNGRYGVQVFSIGVRVTSLTTSPPSPLQDLLIEEDRDIGGLGGSTGEYIVSGDISSESEAGFVTLLSSTGCVYVLKFDEEDQNMVILTSSESEPSDSHSFQLGAKATFSSVSLFHGILDLESSELFDASDPIGTPSAHSKQSRGGGNDTPLSTPRFQRSVSLQSEASTNNDSVSTPISKGRQSSYSGKGNDERKNIDSLTAEEEVFLYGKRLLPNPFNEDAYVPKDASISLIRGQKFVDTYLVLSDNIGILHFVRLSDFKLVFVTSPLGVGAKNIQIFSGDRCSEVRTHFTQTCDRIYKVVDCKVELLGGSKPMAGASSSRLTIVALLDTADIVVFAANSCDISSVSGLRATVKGFFKVHSDVITRRRKTRVRLKRSSAGGNAGHKNVLMTQSPTHSPLDSCLAYGIKRSVHIDGRSGIACYGLKPVFIFNDFGLPSMMPLTFPELPHALLGYNIVAPVVLGNGTVSGLVTLFVEVKSQSADSFVPPPPPPPVSGGAPQPPPPPGPRPITSAGVMGLYREIVGLATFPGSGVSMKRTMTGRTIHEVMEILPMTDEKSQLDLLKKRTFFMSTSIEVERPFLSNVVSEEEEAEDSANYGRFFPSLKSFGQLSDPLAPAPMIKEKEYSVVLVQNNVITEEFKMKPNESILGIEVLYFNVPDTTVPPSMKKTKRHIFLAASTSIDDLHGDDSQSEGRLLLFSLDYAVYDDKKSDPATSTTTDSASNFLDTIQPKLKLMWTDHGPSTVVKQLGSQYVIATVGPTIFIYSFSSILSTLEKISFYFAPFYVTKISVIKNYILIGDAVRSVQFLQWIEAESALSLVARDYNSIPSLTSSFVVDGKKLGMVSSDDEGNLQLLQYNPRVLESKKGFRLLPRADFHLGSVITMLLSHRNLDSSTTMAFAPAATPGSAPPPPPGRPTATPGSRLSKTTCPRHSSLLGTTDGELGILVGVDDRSHRRLLLLQQIMGSVVESTCGLNHRDYRFVKTSKYRLDRKRNVLDGTLLWRFMDLDIKTQDELSGAMGTTADVILENLVELDNSWGFF